MLSTENNTNNKNEEIRKEFESQTIIDTDVADFEVVNNGDDTHLDAEKYRALFVVVNNGDDTHPDAEKYRELFEVAHMREHNMKTFRSVCISGILWTLVFGGCVGYLIDIDYIASEWGTPILGGLIAIFTGFFIGFWRNK